MIAERSCGCGHPTFADYVRARRREIAAARRRRVCNWFRALLRMPPL